MCFKMDVITETSLEALLQRATDYRNKTTDTAAIEAICGIIKKEAEGPVIASRLIASKIQSSEEWEALQGLTVLETCMKNCGSPFHSEIGKFRFLNEMIKLVSPKFLGLKTPESVRNEVLKLMHDWTLSYPREYKIKEAYDMLLKQGVIQKNNVPMMVDSKATASQSTQKENHLFQDEEIGRLLQKLLHSKNPNDLQAANRLIKTMVKEDEKRVETKSKKNCEVERVSNNVLLLSEMLESYLPGQSSYEELELIKELHQSCERLKPNLVRLVSEAQDNEFLNKLLSVNDAMNQVLAKYKNIIAEEREINKVSCNLDKTKQVSALLDLSTPIEEFVPLIIENKSSVDALNQSVINSDCLISPLECSEPVTDAMETSTKHPSDSVFSSLSSQNKAGPSFVQILNYQKLEEKVKPLEKNKKFKGLEELDILSESLLQQCKINAVSKKTNLERANTIFDNEFENMKLKDDNEVISLLSQGKVQSHTKADVLKCMPEPPFPSKNEVKALSNIFISLENIRPSCIPPITLIEEKNGISVTIHLARDSPKEDVSVYVVTTLSKNPFPLTNYVFQAVVPKDCKLKLQPPSGSELPPHNPFLPPSAITQIMLIANPNKVNLTLKCMISYTMEEETFTEMAEVEQLITGS